MTITRRTMLAAPLVLIAGSSAHAQKREVDVLLVLAIDASGSVDEDEWNLNKRGYAEALVHREVLRAIRNGPNGSIAVTAMKWGHPNYQEVVLPWTVITDIASAEIASGAMLGLPYRTLGNTSISAGIEYSTQLLQSAPFSGLRKVIDVSGDGFDNTSRRYPPSNYSFGGRYQATRSSINPVDTVMLHHARDEAIRKGITINGLPILTDQPWLDEYYTESVIGGPGSFMIPAKDFESFSFAIRRKLILEIAHNPSLHSHG